MKRILAFLLCLIILMPFSAAAEASIDIEDYLKGSNANTWGVLALYANGFSLEGIDLEEVVSGTTTDYEAYIFGAAALGKDISRCTQKLVDCQRNNGKFADSIDGSGADLINSHIWGIISLYAAGEEGYNKVNALQWLRNNQNEDGGFAVFAGDDYSDVDMTCMAVVAYSVLGLNPSSEEISSALEFIDQNVESSETCETLSWVILARVMLGLDASGELYGKLLEYRLEDGTFSHFKSSAKPNYMATWHGYLALADYSSGKSIFTRLNDLGRVKHFTDVDKGDYAYEEITYLAGKGIISGSGDGSFKPENLVTRAEFAKMLVIALGLQNENVGKYKGFQDVQGHWSERFVNIAAKEGLINGIGSNRFAPERNITGAETAALAVRAKGLENFVAPAGDRSWYMPYVDKALENRLLYEGFNAHKYTTRAQSAELIYKLIN